MWHHAGLDDLGAGVETGTTLPEEAGESPQRSVEPQTLVALVVIWSRDDPETTGSLFGIPTGRPNTEFVLGRTSSKPKNPNHLQLTRHRPGSVTLSPPITCRYLSRAQLGVRALDDHTLLVRRLGACSLAHNHRTVESARVEVGSTIQLGNYLALVAVRRPAFLLDEDTSGTSFPFGAADRDGIVGESPAAWAMRRQIAFTSNKAGHVLIRGPSGTGKELVARALHARSPRGNRPLVARNAATFPEGLIDAELFGNMRGYPNPGMPERPGLIGEAHNSTLFLDEFAEFPQSMQAHLLRVLDQGEYQRLGEARTRHSDFRLIAATNRPDSYLKADLAARLPLRLTLPDLNSRREDIPLMSDFLLRSIAAAHPEIDQRFFNRIGSQRWPRMSPSFICSLVQHQYAANVRELEACLWEALARSPGNSLDVPATESTQLAPPLDPTKPQPMRRASPVVDISQIQRALDENEGRIDQTYQVLGLASRHVLSRLIAKHQLVAGRDWIRRRGT